MNRLSTDPVALFEAARDGHRLALARLMSIIERGSQEARTLGAHTFSRVGRAHTVGMTGAPGSGKSTLTARDCCSVHRRADGDLSCRPFIAFYRRRNPW